jgi:hypothetical protein
VLISVNQKHVVSVEETKQENLVRRESSPSNEGQLSGMYSFLSIIFINKMDEEEVHWITPSRGQERSNALRRIKSPHFTTVSGAKGVQG